MVRGVSTASVVLMAIGLLVGLYGGVDGTPAHALSNCSVTHDALAANEQEMLGLINAERESQGLPPYVSSPNLNRAAAWMSEDMANRVLLTHKTPGPLHRSRGCRTAAIPTRARPKTSAWGRNRAADLAALWLRRSGIATPSCTRDTLAVRIGELTDGWWTLDFERSTRFRFSAANAERLSVGLADAESLTKSHPVAITEPESVSHGGAGLQARRGHARRRG